MKLITTNSVDEAFWDVCESFVPGISKDTFTQLNDYRKEFRFRETEDETSPDKGKRMLERSFMLVIKNPRNRLVVSKQVDIFNLVGLWVYLLRGSKSRAQIEFYNDRARHFIDEESSVTELRANWGERIFGEGNFSRVVELLKRKPPTRRAVLPVFRPEDIGYPSRNLPCLVSIQFALNNGFLDMYTTMRSQAAVGVMPYDLFLLTMLHEYTAVRAGQKLGVYHHFAPLTGIRESEIPIIWNVVRHKPAEPWMEMPAMEALEPGQKAVFLDAEALIRKGNPIWENIAAMLPPYWQSLLAVTMAKQMLRKGGEFWEVRLAEAGEAFPIEFLRNSKDRIKEAVR